MKITLRRTTSKIAVVGKQVKSFMVNRGLREDDPLSTTMFNFVLKNILRESNIETNEIILQQAPNNCICRWNCFKEKAGARNDFQKFGNHFQWIRAIYEWN